MASVFSKIVAGEIPCYKIAEDEQFFAFLDIRPLTKGHCLVIPKKEIDYIFDLENTLLADIMIFARKIAVAQKKALVCKRIGIAVIGMEVPHAHIHLIPIQTESDMLFSNPKLDLSKETMQSIAESISKYV